MSHEVCNLGAGQTTFFELGAKGSSEIMVVVADDVELLKASSAQSLVSYIAKRLFVAKDESAGLPVVFQDVTQRLR